MPSKFVYLDQNKWIDLSRAHYGVSGGEQFKGCLDRARTAVKKGTTVFPLAAAHFVETWKSADVPRQKRLFEVMNEFSQATTVAPSPKLIPLQIKNTVAKFFNGKGMIEPSVWGQGVMFAFGYDDPRYTALHELIGPRAALATFLGFADASEVSSSIKNYRESMKAFAKDEAHYRDVISAFSEDTRYNVYAESLIEEHLKTIMESLVYHGVSHQDFLNLGKSGMTSFIENVPSLHVEMKLATERNKHNDRNIAPNDFEDIAFLKVAIPYCDIVITEKFWVDLVKRTGLEKQYCTTMLSDLAKLEEYLPATL